MNYLLDTHGFIWWMEGGKKLPLEIKSVLQDSTKDIFVSVASVWEIVIKKSKGRLKTPKDIEGGITEAGFKILSVEISHALEVEKLPFYPNHKDPFDRMLISQAKVERLTLITSDPKIWKYKINILKS